MAEEKRELLEKLKFELAFVEDGGYGPRRHLKWRYFCCPGRVEYADKGQPHL